MIRLWEILREIDSAKNGAQIGTLARQFAVHQRTIRRDLEALCAAGFPLYDERVNRTPVWKLRARPFRALEERGVSLAELCALYFGRAVLAILPGAAFRDNADRVLVKLDRALSHSCRPLLDRFRGTQALR